MSEETKMADKTAAWGIVLAVSCSAVSGFIYVTALMFSIQVTHLSLNIWCYSAVFNLWICFFALPCSVMYLSTLVSPHV